MSWRNHLAQWNPAVGAFQGAIALVMLMIIILLLAMFAGGGKREEVGAIPGRLGSPADRPYWMPPEPQAPDAQPRQAEAPAPAKALERIAGVEPAPAPKADIQTQPAPAVRASRTPDSYAGIPVRGSTDFRYRMISGLMTIEDRSPIGWEVVRLLASITEGEPGTLGGPDVLGATILETREARILAKGRSIIDMMHTAIHEGAHVKCGPAGRDHSDGCVMRIEVQALRELGYEDLAQQAQAVAVRDFGARP